MANVKNFGLVGVGSDLQLGKAGTRLINNSGVFNFKAADGSTNAALTAAGITSAAGNVTLTTGNLVLSDNAGTVGIGGATLSRHAANVLQFDGTAAFMAPVGNTAARPTAATGMIRVNNDTPATSYVEFYNGTAWTTLATGGSTGALQTEIDNIEASLGTGINTDGTFNGAGFTGAGLGSVTSFTDAINTVANNAAGKDTLDEIFPSLSAGNVIYSNGSNLWAQAAPGATSGVQAYSAKLQSLATNATNGIIVQDSSGTVVARTLVAPAAGITITNADGVSGNPTFALANDLAGLEALTGTGYSIRTGDGTWTTRTIAGTAGNIVVTNGDGVASNTDINLATVSQAATGDFVKITLDTFGRVTGNTAVVAGDITSLVDTTYLRLDGTNAMTADLNAGGFKVTNLADPTASTDAATKNYVDNAVTGLSWKQAVHTIAVSNVPLTGGATLTIDGQSMLNTERVLLINQTDPYEDGIYVVSGIGTAYVLTRSSDANTFQELNGAAVFVQTGTTYADTGWVQTATLTSLTTGDTQTWVQFSGAGSYTGGVGIDVTGNVISAKLGAGIAAIPTGEIGIDLFDPSSGALILTTTGTNRSTATGATLGLLLAGSGGLTQDTTGLYINAAGVTNAMLVNSTITLNADAGTQDPLALGETLLIAGTAGQGISTTVSNNTITITAADATTASRGVASFNSASFSVSSGAVSLNTVDVAHGGTGATSFTANQVLYGNGTSAIQSSADFTFVPGATDVLTIGGATGVTLSSDGTDAFLTSLATNSDLVLLPNGTGSVVVGPAGAGLIQSDAGQALTVRGNTTLTLNAVSGDVVMQVAASTANKVTVSGATAAQYATGLADEDLTNKKYVDDAIASGASAGAVKAFQAVVPLDADGTTNIGTAMPAGATVLSVKVQVNVVDTAATLSVGKTGNVAAYMTTSENDPQTTGLYMAECFVTEAGSVQLIATVASSAASSGATCTVIVQYQVAQ